MDLTALTWLLVLVFLVSHVTADPGDDSVNNMFSDLAPYSSSRATNLGREANLFLDSWLSSVNSSPSSS
jgi:hypothetical protein